MAAGVSQLKNIIIILFLILFCSPVSNSSAYEDIRQSGLMRLSDIFLLTDSWDVSTIDAMTGMVASAHSFLSNCPVFILETCSKSAL